MAQEFVNDEAIGMEKVVLREPGGATAEIHLYGGHITSWKNKEGAELLFMSSKAVFKSPKTIRGGIQVCFPHFSGSGVAEKLHGFACNRKWQVDPNPPPPPPSASTSASTSLNDVKPYIDLVLKPAEEVLKIGLHQRIMLGLRGELTSVIQVINYDNKPFTSTFALLNFLRVSNIEEVRVEGLATLDFLDNLQEKRNLTFEQEASITFDSEVDLMYLRTPTTIAIVNHDINEKRTFVLKKEGLPDVVVWNPWDKRTKSISAYIFEVLFGDEKLKSAKEAFYGDGEYKRMLCVGAAAMERAFILQPGQQWMARQEISVVPSDYYMGQLDPIKS